jgi:phage terminase Nu1 subunit (DNA packaging protein)
MRGRPPGKSLSTATGLPQTCSKSDLAHILGISVRSVTDWDQKGVFKRANGRGRYELVPSVNGYTGALREQAAGRASATGLQLTDERALTEQVVRQIKERELAKLKGETMTLSEVTDSWSMFASAVKAAVLSIPGKARGVIPHLTAHDGDVLKHMCRDILMDLAEEVEAAVVSGVPEEISGEK